MRPDLVELGETQLAELSRQLGAAGLPCDDVGEPGRLFYRLDLAGAPMGWAGLEPHGGDALLRSVVVPSTMRGRNRGHLLVSAMAARARALGAERLWLLTTTAAGFFTALGFESAPRESAPETIRATREFASLCPASAVCMVLDLVSRQEAR